MEIGHRWFTWQEQLVEFPQSQARASEVNPTQVLQGTR